MESKYSTARGVANIISIFGWLCIILPLVLIIFSLIIRNPPNTLTELPFIIGSVVGGICLLAYSQLIKAIADIADNSYQILHIISSNAENEGDIISKNN